MESYNIEKYALELTVYSIRDSDILDIEEVRFSECTYHIGDAVIYTVDAFSVHFQEIIHIPILANLSADQFISYILPICLNLCEIPINFNIVLAFSFLFEIVTSLSNQYNCFRFLDAAKKCLVALIKSNVHEIGLWNSLTTYCHFLNNHFSRLGAILEPIDLLCPNPEYKDSVLRMIYFCDVSDIPISFPRYESESFLETEEILQQEKENIELESLLLSCDFCGETCELLAHRSVDAHLHNTRSINVDVLNMHARLFRVLMTNNTPPTQDRRILLDE